MRQSLAYVALIVRDYDEAIDFYVRRLGFVLTADEMMPEGKRWVLVAPPGYSGAPAAASILLAKASDDRQAGFVGDQAGGRVFLFLSTDDFDRDYARMLDEGIVFVRPPKVAPYGKVAVFLDLYGNRWDLVQAVNLAT